jgi:hypothetical protein
MSECRTQPRLARAFEKNESLCEPCGLGFRDYWLMLSGMNDNARPKDYAFAVPAEAITRVPMCRSSAPICHGMCAIYRLRYGAQAACDFEQGVIPMVPH